MKLLVVILCVGIFSVQSYSASKTVKNEQNIIGSHDPNEHDESECKNMYISGTLGKSCPASAVDRSMRTSYSASAQVRENNSGEAKSKKGNQ